MYRRSIERRLGELQTRLGRARSELELFDEQLMAFSEMADEARLRSLVSETPLAAEEWQEAEHHAEIARRGKEAAAAAVSELTRARDELLDKLVV